MKTETTKEGLIHDQGKYLDLPGIPRDKAHITTELINSGVKPFYLSQWVIFIVHLRHKCHLKLVSTTLRQHVCTENILLFYCKKKTLINYSFGWLVCHLWLLEARRCCSTKLRPWLFPKCLVILTVHYTLLLSSTRYFQPSKHGISDTSHV